MTQILNIDELKYEPPVVVVLRGKEHAMVEQTVEGLIANMDDLQSLNAAASGTEELELIIRMILRAIPSLTDEDVRSLPVAALNQLFLKVRGAENDSEVSEDEAGKSKAGA